MDVRALTIAGAWEFTPRIHSDDRGDFLEWYRFEKLEELLGSAPVWRQANTSISARGVLRGIHYSVADPGQSKYVTVTHGRALDFVVDIRPDSETFRQWDVVELDAVTRRAVYIDARLGHAFLALDDDTTVSYLCTQVHDPAVEFSIDPLDPEIGLDLSAVGSDIRLSPRDAAAPTLARARLAESPAKLMSQP